MSGPRQDDRRKGAASAPCAPARVEVACVLAGDTVVAEDGRAGRVDRVLHTESDVPAYLVVATGGRLRRRYPVVPWDLVSTVDRSRRLVHVRARRAMLGRLSESLPLFG